MEFFKKYPKTFQWLFLLIVFFALCFAIEVPETYKFIRGQAEFVKDPNQSSYVFLGKEVRYYAFDVFWRLPPLLGWLPIWINDSLFFLMNEWMPIEVWNEDTQEFKSRPIVLQISRNLTAFMTFLIELIREILLGGLETIVAFTSWDWIDKNPWAELPGLPWTIVAAGAALLSYKAKWQRFSFVCWVNNGLYFYIWSMETINANSIIYISCSTIIIYFWFRFRDSSI